MPRLPIAAILCIQACLLFTAPDLLPVWNDELFTLKAVAHPVREIIPIVRQDIHPPLYFILLRALPWHGIAALRAFSAVWALLATLLLDLFWTRSWPPMERWLAVSLFAFSPCLLLYGRMARSYSMQIVLVLLSVALLQRYMASPSWIAGPAAVAAVLALLYTHYLPGLAVLAGFILVARRRAGYLLLGVAAGYLPWLLTLGTALQRWRGAPNFSSRYALTGNPFLEQILKVAFGLVSLTIGESFFALSLLLVPVILLLAIRGTRRIPAIIAIAAVIGYLGVARWVSYPFIPARLLWLLPFLSMAAASGILHVAPRPLRLGIIAAILLSYASSDILYFHRQNFLNPGYTAPLPEIAAAINRRATPHDLILVDSYNTDFQALAMYLSTATPVIDLDPYTASSARRAISSAATIWIVRNTRDISPGQLTSSIRQEACTGRSQRITLYEPFAAWQEVAIRLLGIHPVPTHFYELTVCGGK